MGSICCSNNHPFLDLVFNCNGIILYHICFDCYNSVKYPENNFYYHLRVYMARRFVFLLILISICLSVNGVYTFMWNLNLNELIFKLVISNIIILIPLVVNLFKIDIDLLKI